ADLGLVVELAGGDALERVGAVEAELSGLEDDAHAAAGDLAEELVVAEIADADRLGCVGIGRSGLVEPHGRGQVVRRLGWNESCGAGWPGGALIDRRGRHRGPRIEGGRRRAGEGWTGSGVRGLDV